MDSNLLAEKKKLSKLVNFKNISDEALTKVAQKNVTLRELLDSGNFLDDKEKKQAKQCFEKYLETNDFESYSDLSTLSMLVFNEILVNRIQKTINQSSNKDGTCFINDKLVKSLHEAENQVLSLKLKLGVDAEKEEDEFTALQLLKKRFSTHIMENRHEFTIAIPFSCASCGKEDVKLVLVRRNVKDFKAIDHPHFSGRFWFNKVAMEMVESGRLSKEEYAKIFSTSVDYVNWCLQNKGRILPTTESK